MKYDCIIPWSGGVESTAVVNWAVNNKKTPLCIHNRMHPAEWAAVSEMANILGVDVFKVQVANDFPIDPNTRDFYAKLFGFTDPKWNPGIQQWTYFCVEANLRWPLIDKIYYGHCGAGAVIKGDGAGDQMHEMALVIFNSFEKFLNTCGVKTKFIAPLDHLTKREQWLSLPEELKKQIMTCHKFESNVNRTNCKSYSCNKCHELMRAVPNDELHLIR